MDGTFYELIHEGQPLRLPRVTAILKVIDRSGPLMGWATKLEREAFKMALEDALTEPGELTPQTIWDRVNAKLGGRRAWAKARDAAADIGKAAHGMIHWHTERMLGLDPGPEPAGPEAATRAVLAWLDWTAKVDFKPLHTERLVYCPACGYAGTTDTVAAITNEAGHRYVAVIDYKTGKAVYWEAFMQLLAYRHALQREGIATDGALVLRLPKTAADPDFEAVPAPFVPFGYWISVCRTWRLSQRMTGQDTGSVEITRCEVPA